MNAFEMLELLRDNLNEASAAVHSDLNLVRRLNRAQNKIALAAQMHGSAWLLKMKEVTPVASVVSLPIDCAKPVYLKEKDSGNDIPWLLSVTHEGVSRTRTDSYFEPTKEAYAQRRQLVVNFENFASVCQLYYFFRPPDLVVATTGNVGVSGENFLLLPNDLNTKRLDDYYEDVVFEVVDGTGAGTVGTATAYVGSTRKVTVAGTFGADSLFGSASVLPEEVHNLIVLEATASALGKPSTNMDKEVFQRFFIELRVERDLVDNWLASVIPGATRSVLVGEEF